MSLKNRQDIYESPSQHVEINIETLVLLEDRLLVRELAEEEKEGSIIIPQNARGRSRYRIGVVVATGPGNRFIEMGITEEGQVRRRLITSGEPCGECKGTGKHFKFRSYELIDCPICHGEKVAPRRVPCSCKVGDRIMFDQRKESQVYLNGVSHFLIYEEQACIGVLDPVSKWVCTWCGAPSHKPSVDELVTCAKCGTNGCEEVK